MIEATESAIVARLAPLVQQKGVVVPLAETNGGFARTADGYRVTVSYYQSKFRNGDRANDVARSKTTGGMVVQDEFMEFRVTVEARRIRGDMGVYAVAQAVKALLLGFRPPHSGKLYFDPEGIIMPQWDKDNGVWFAVLTFISETAALEDTEGEVGPLLERIRAANETTADNPALEVPRPSDE